MSYADLSNANLAVADISDAAVNDAVSWEDATWTSANFHYRDRPHFPDEMNHEAYGIVIVPELATLPVLALSMLMAWRNQWGREFQNGDIIGMMTAG